MGVGACVGWKKISKLNKTQFELFVSEWISLHISWIKLFLITIANFQKFNLFAKILWNLWDIFCNYVEKNWWQRDLFAQLHKCCSKGLFCQKNSLSKMEQKHFPNEFVLMSIGVWSDNVTADDGKIPNTRHLISLFQVRFLL